MACSKSLHHCFGIGLVLNLSLLLNSCVMLQPPPPCTQNLDGSIFDIGDLLAIQPDFSYDFESGWNAALFSGDVTNRSPEAPAWRYAHMQRASAGTTVPDPLNNLNMVMQFSWVEGEGASYDSNTQKKAHLYGDYGLTAYEEEVWSFDVYFPSAGMESDSESEIIIQFHGVPDSGEAYREPPIALDNHNDEITLTWRYDYREITPAGFNGWDERVVEFGATPKDRWVNYVFHIKYSPEGCGILRVWQDSELMVNEVGVPIGYNDQAGAYLGFGIYKWSNKSSVNTSESGGSPRRILFDNVRKWEISS